MTRQAARSAIRTLMWRDVGLVCSKDSLRRASQELAWLAMGLGAGASETHNRLTVARAVTHAAFARRDSRGGHFCTDAVAAADARREVSGRSYEPRPS